MIRIASLIASTVFAAGAMAAPALAQNIRIQSGLLCDTAEQAARVTELARRGDLKDAIAQVNLEAEKPMACGFAAVAYTDSEEVNEIRADNGVRLYRIIRVTVVGFKDGEAVTRIAPTQQYAVAPAKSLEA